MPEDIKPEEKKPVPVSLVMDIEYEGKPAQVTFKKFTFGDRNEVLKKALGNNGSVKYYSEETTMVEVNPVELREQLLLRSIKEAPFPHKTVEDLRKIEADLADALIERAEQINPFRLNI